MNLLVLFLPPPWLNFLAFEKFLESQGKGQLEPSLSSEHGLRTPNEAFFFIEIHIFLALADKLGR